jgi:hypothetical protein
VCPTATFAPANQYGIRFNGTLSGGSLSVGATLTAANISARFCGLQNPFSLNGAVAANGVAFDPAIATILRTIQLPLTVEPAAAALQITGKDPSGALEARMTTNVSSSVTVAGVTCAVGPISMVLTTGQSGQLRGVAFTGPIDQARGVIVSNDFAVPPVQPSATCPSFVATLVNVMAGLPLAAGRSQITLNVEFGLHQ